jgi:hypothetical protein
VVYVSASTFMPPSPKQVVAIAGAMRVVAGTRFVWSLPKACHGALLGDMDA